MPGYDNRGAYARLVERCNLKKRDISGGNVHLKKILPGTRKILTTVGKQEGCKII
jgi:hypothetical protein